MSETSTLIGYGCRTIGREELSLVPTPAPTETHRPVPHHEIVQALIETLGFRHIGVVHDEYAVSPDGMKAFGVLDLDRDGRVPFLHRFAKLPMTTTKQVKDCIRRKIVLVAVALGNVTRETVTLHAAATYVSGPYWNGSLEDAEATGKTAIVDGWTVDPNSAFVDAILNTTRSVPKSLY
jgi:hypothetical protein